MRLLTKVAVLSAILIVNLLFFLVLPTYFPETFDRVFQMVPWSDDVEKAVAIFLGFAVAATSSTLIAYIFVQQVRKSLQRGVGN